MPNEEAIGGKIMENLQFVNKLVDELVEANNYIKVNEMATDRLDTLINLILNSSKIGHGDFNRLRIEDETPMFQFIKACYPSRYESRLYELIADRENKLKKESDNGLDN